MFGPKAADGRIFMKDRIQLVVLLALVLCFTTLLPKETQAKEVKIGSQKRFGIGLSGGFPSASITGKFYLTSKLALQVDLAMPFVGFGSYLAPYVGASFDYLVVFRHRAGRLFVPFHLGAYFLAPLASQVQFGLSILAGPGIGWHFSRFPLELVLRASLGATVLPAIGLFIGTNFAVRYYF